MQEGRVNSREVWKKIKLHGTQTRAATNPLDLVEKKLHGTQTSQLLVPEGDPGWKKIELQDTQTSSAEALVWTRKKLHGTQTRKVDYRFRRR